jgi:hypothetical protein
VPTVANDQRSGALSGLVTVEGAMIALIDLANLLAAFEAAGNAPRVPADIVPA